MVLTVWTCWPKNTSQPAAHGHWRGSWPRKFWLRLRDFHWTTNKKSKKPHKHQLWKGLHPYIFFGALKKAQDPVLMQPSESKYLVSSWILFARFQAPVSVSGRCGRCTIYEPHRVLLKTASLNFPDAHCDLRVSSTYGDGDVICKQLWQEEILYRHAWLILGVISISILLVVIYCQAGARDSTESTKSFCNKSCSTYFADSAMRH